MSETVRPDEAAQALTEIGQRQEQVIKLAIIPTWFWWAVAALMVGFSAAVDSRRPLAIAIGTTIFVIGVLTATGRVVARSALRAPLRNDLISPVGVLAILGFVAAILAVTLPAAFALRAAGADHPATYGVLGGAIVMVVGGPMLTRFLQRIMLANRLGVPKRQGSPK